MPYSVEITGTDPPTQAGYGEEFDVVVELDPKEYMSSRWPYTHATERANGLSRVRTGGASHIRRAQPPTNPLNGGLFHANAATKPGCAGAGAGSGERHDETEQTHF